MFKNEGYFDLSMSNHTNETLGAIEPVTTSSDAVNATFNETIANPVDTTSEYLHGWFRGGLEATQIPFLQGLIENPYLFALFSVAVGFVLSYVLVYLSQTVILAFTRRTATDLDDKLVERLRHPVAISLFIFFLNVALVPIAFTSGAADVLNKLIASGNLILIGTIINRVLATLFEHYGKKGMISTASKTVDHIFPLVRKFITLIVYAFVFLFILMLWGVQIAPLLAGAGIAGLAIAFSLQETLKNLFGGVSLAIDKSFTVGDRIKLNDGTVGTVQDISLRSTKIRTFDGDLIVVPNGKIANENFHTYAQPTQETRVFVTFGVVYGSDVAKTKKVVLDAIKGIEHQIDRPEQGMGMGVQFTEMGAYSLNFRAAFWVDDYRNSWDAKLEATQRIYDALNKAKIEIALPTQVIYTKK